VQPLLSIDASNTPTRQVNVRPAHFPPLAMGRVPAWLPESVIDDLFCIKETH
jgi:hypothetical protein